MNENVNLLDTIDRLNGALGATDEFETSIDEATIGRLVAKGKISPAAAKEVTKTVNAGVKRRMLNSTLTRDQRFLLSQISKLPTDSKIAVATGGAQFTLVDVYIRRLLTGGSQQNLVKPADVEEVGLQNIQGNSLKEGENMVVSAIKLAYAFSSTSGDSDPKKQAYTNAMDAETAGSAPLAIPTAFLNGEVEFRTEGTTVLRLPVKRFFREGLSVGVGVEGGADAVQLPSPILLKAKQAFEIILHGANGVAMTVNATNNHFVEVRLMGTGVTLRR